MASLRDCTVLLVDPPTLPPRLEAVLSARGAFAETTDPDRLAGTLIVSSPDVIVASDRHKELVCRAIRTLSGDQKVPFVMIGRGSDATRLRGEDEGIDGVISPDMPSSAMAVRIQTILTKIQTGQAPTGRSVEKEATPKLAAKAARPTRQSDASAPRTPRTPSTVTKSRTVLGVGAPAPSFRKETKAVHGAKSKQAHETAKHETAKHETAKHETAKHETAKHETAKHETAKHETAKHETPRGLAAPSLSKTKTLHGVEPLRSAPLPKERAHRALGNSKAHTSRGASAAKNGDGPKKPIERTAALGDATGKLGDATGKLGDATGKLGDATGKLGDATGKLEKTAPQLAAPSPKISAAKNAARFGDQATRRRNSSNTQTSKKAEVSDWIPAVLGGKAAQKTLESEAEAWGEVLPLGRLAAESTSRVENDASPVECFAASEQGSNESSVKGSEDTAGADGAFDRRSPLPQVGALAFKVSSEREPKRGTDAATRRSQAEYAPAPTSPHPAPEAHAPRVSLEIAVAEIPSARIALLDENVARIDALANALRSAGHEVFLLSRASGVERWRLLRRFAPQTIVMDELGPALDGGAWLTAFRGDPFLKNTPLIAIPLATLYDESSDTVHLSALTPRLEGVNRTELALLGQLSPKREVEVRLEQLNAARLLQLLTTHEKSADLKCEDGPHKFHWQVTGGNVGKARLEQGESHTELSPHAALRWLLERQDGCIVVRQRASNECAEGLDVARLLEEAHAEAIPTPVEFAAPVGPQSLAPAAPGDTYGLKPDATIRLGPLLGVNSEKKLEPSPNQSGQLKAVVEDDLPALVGDSEPMLETPPGLVRDVCDSEFPTQRISISQLSRLSKDTLGNGSSAEPLLEAPLAPQAPPPPNRRELTAVAGSAEANGEEEGNRESAKWSTVTGLVQVLESLGNTSKTWSLPSRPVQIGIAAATLLALVGTMSAIFGGDAEAETSAAAPSSATEEIAKARVEPDTSGATEKPHPEGGETPEQQQPVESAVERADHYFRVNSNKDAKSCDAILTEPRSYFTSKPRWQGKAIWKKARHQLLIGEKETAHVLMCQAALVDPLGRASVGLGDFYLSQRALEEARTWAEYGIQHRADFARSDKELLGDVLCQMGDVQEARKEWLETMKVESDDIIKLQAVSRSLTNSASQTRRGGDYPLAERLLRRAVVLDEENVEAAAQLSEALFKNGQPELAERWATRALRMDPTAGYALLASGDLAAAAGDKDRARTLYQKISEDSSASQKAEERLSSL